MTDEQPAQGVTEQNGPVEEAFDPFSQENIPIIQFITQARIYDVLMALLSHFDPEAASDLLALHAEGNLVSTAPNFNGQFITDILSHMDDSPSDDMSPSDDE